MVASDLHCAAHTSWTAHLLLLEICFIFCAWDVELKEHCCEVFRGVKVKKYTASDETTLTILIKIKDLRLVPPLVRSSVVFVDS